MRPRLHAAFLVPRLTCICFDVMRHHHADCSGSPCRLVPPPRRIEPTGTSIAARLSLSRFLVAHITRRPHPASAPAVLHPSYARTAHPWYSTGSRIIGIPLFQAFAQQVRRRRYGRPTVLTISLSLDHAFLHAGSGSPKARGAELTLTTTGQPASGHQRACFGFAAGSTGRAGPARRRPPCVAKGGRADFRLIQYTANLAPSP
jgi:hypothetical protein